jgi:hypothetical protein
MKNMSNNLRIDDRSASGQCPQATQSVFADRFGIVFDIILTDAQYRP